jgi:hypothetical protein
MRKQTASTNYTRLAAHIRQLQSIGSKSGILTIAVKQSLLLDRNTLDGSGRLMAAITAATGIIRDKRLVLYYRY